MPFDWEFYLRFHPDLAESLPYTEEAAKEHYEKYGRHKRLATSLDDLRKDFPLEFDLDEYVSLYPHLKYKYKESYLYHWIYVDYYRHAPKRPLYSDVSGRYRQEIDHANASLCVVICHGNEDDQHMWDKCIHSILNQSYQSFDIVELDYSGNGIQVVKEYNLSGHTYTFYNVELPTCAHAQNFCHTKVFNAGYRATFIPDHRTFYGHRLFEEIIKTCDTTNVIVQGVGKCGLKIGDKLYRVVSITSKAWDSFDDDGNPYRFRQQDGCYEIDETISESLTNINTEIYECESCTNIPVYTASLGSSSIKRKDVRIGIILIATGRYVQYLNATINYIDKFFLPKYTRTIYVWTDNPDHVHKSENIVITPIVRHGFPGDTLYRYHYIIMKEWDLITNTDLIYYADIDIEIIDEIGDEFVPTPDKPFVVISHPDYINYGLTASGMIDQTPISTAYIPPEYISNPYAIGAIQGGYTPYFMKMVEKIVKGIDEDDYNEYVAKWHDESHFNHYMMHNRKLFKFMAPGYYYVQHYPNEVCNYGTKIVGPFKVHDVVRTTSDMYITVQLSGKLGVQLYQISCIMECARKNNLIPYICVNLSSCNVNYRSYRESIFRHLLRWEDYNNEYYVYEEDERTYNDIVLPPNKHIKLVGTFISWKYFDKNFKIISDLIPIEWKVKAKKIYDSITDLFTIDTVAVHVPPDELETSFYSSCVKVLGTEKTYIIHTSEPSRVINCEPLKALKRLYIVSEPDPIIEMLIMGNCKTLLISSSINSWWAAYLSGSKYVYYSSNLSKHVKTPLNNVVLPHWIEISAV